MVKTVQARWEWGTGKGGVGYRKGRSGVEAVQVRSSEVHVEALQAWGEWGRVLTVVSTSLCYLFIFYIFLSFFTIERTLVRSMLVMRQIVVK